MSKAKKQQMRMTKKRSLYSVRPWSCVHRRDKSEIIAHVEYTGKPEVIAIVPKALGIDAEKVAEFIVRTVNEHEKNQNQMHEAIAALELCLESDGLTWEAEQAADITVRRVKQRA